MADEYTKDLLTKWGLSQLITSFKDADIDQAAMESLGSLDQKELINELIPSIGKRAIFLSKLKSQMSVLDIPVVAPVDITATTITCDNEVAASTSNFLEIETIMIEDHANKVGGSVSHVFTVEEVELAVTGRPTSSQTGSPVIIKKTVSPSCTAKGGVPYPSPLPDLSPFLKLQHESGNLKTKHFLQFVKECGHFLASITNGRPTSKDYNNFSLSLVDKYPEFKDHASLKPNGTLKLRLSHYLRNQRTAQKKANCKESSAGMSSARKTIYDHVSVSGSSQNMSQDTSDEDTDSMIKQLKAHGKSGSTHAQLLLKKTFHLRREFVKSADTCKSIVAEFPHLENYEMFISDFYMIEGIQNNPTAFEEIVSLLVKIEDNHEADAVLTEVDKIKIFQRLEKKLHPKGLKGQVRRCLSIEEAGDGAVNIDVDPLQAPGVLVFTEGSELVELFLLAEGQVICHKPAGTAEEAVQLLMAAYFVMHRGYPVAYESFLTFLAVEYLKINENPNYRGSISFNRLIKTYKNLKNSNALTTE